MRRLRLLQLIPDLRHDGGAQVAVANLVSYLDRNRFDVWVGTLSPATQSGLSMLSLPSNRVVCFSYNGRSLQARMIALMRMAAFFRRHQIDIVQTHLSEPNVIGRLAAYVARVPVIISTEHNLRLGAGHQRFRRDAFLSRFTSQILAVSNAVRVSVSQHTGIPVHRIKVIPNGVPLERIRVLSMTQRRKKLADLGIAPEQPIVLSVGRLIEQKGYPVLLKAASHLRAVVPNVQFLICGAGHLEMDLRRQIEGLHLSDTVQLLGVRMDILELLQMSTVLAMPSLWEGLPMVLLEAQACGVPVVASRVGGVPEVISDMRNGLLVPPGDDMALADALAKVLLTPGLGARMGLEGRKIVEARYAAGVVACEAERLYLELWSQVKGGVAHRVSSRS